MLVRDVDFDRFSGVMFWHAGRQDEVYAKRALADQRLDLRQFLGNFIRKPPRCAVHTITARVGDGGNGCDIVGKTKDRYLDTKLITNWGP